jgi:hypothetical protein
MYGLHLDPDSDKHGIKNLSTGKIWTWTMFSNVDGIKDVTDKVLLLWKSSLRDTH